MKLTKKRVKAIVRANMTDGDALSYVPVQKLTVAIALLAISDWCKGCCSSAGCANADCTVSFAADKLVAAISMPAMLDENFNVIPPKEEAKQDDIRRTERRPEA